MYLNRRDLTEKFVILICTIAALAVVGVLFMIIGQVLIGGLPSLSWYFITTSENATPGMGQGIANAIIGTILISLGATVVASPFGLGTAIYMKRYAPDNKITQGFRFLLEVLSGTPSIVVGIFGFLVFVYYIKPFSGGFSLIAGTLALAILVMPVIERAIEEAIDTVSGELEEGSYALGATKWQTIRDITVPAAFTGVMTSFTLGFGRAAEESAVVILTAGYTQYMPELAIKANDKLAAGVKIYPIQDQVATLPYAVYHAFQNSNVVKPSAGFAAAFVLIVIVFSINIAGKALLMRTQSTGKTGGSWFSLVKAKIFPVKKEPVELSPPQPNQRKLDDIIASIIPPGHKPETIVPVSIVPSSPSLKERIAAVFSRANKTSVPTSLPQDAPLQNNMLPSKNPARTFLRTLLPFSIPAALLLLIALLAIIPPLHHILGEASPSLAGLFGAGLAIIIIIAGLIFGVLFAKKSGAFKGKTRRIGYAGVAAGICLLCIAGIVCASTASGLFNTGEQPGVTTTVDKKAQLAALMAQMAEEEAASVQASAPTGAGSSPGNSGTVAAGGNSTAVTVPVKDALSLGEMYQYGDSRHRVRATVYDYKILPYYFWWFIDYNRFVQSMPASGNSYLVVFIRVENTGDQSIVIPTADAFTVGYQGKTYTRLPFLNKSVISELQAEALSSENKREQYYQWIREIGATKRDYAYLTGQTYYENSWLDNSTVNATSSSTNTTNSTTYSWYYLKPGASHAVDGYLIYEVPDEVAANLRATYVNGGFNQISRTRWSLG